MEGIRNPSLFRKMSEPHSDREALGKAVEQFFEDIQAAREKAVLKNVAVIIDGSYLQGDGEASVYTMLRLGDSSAAEAMFAYGYGAAKKERQQLLGELLSGK